MILYRYIIREHILPFLYSLGIIIFILSMQFLVQLLPNIIAKGLSPGVVLELYLINIAWVMALAIPMAILVSTLMAFGQMSGNNEIMAIKASGHNVTFLLAPVFAAACVLTVLTNYFSNDILPDANHHATNLLTDISRKKPAALLEPGVLITSFENYALYAKKVNANTGALRDVKIFSQVPGEDPSTTVADHGEVTLTKDEKLLRLTLYNGETHRQSVKNKNEYFVGRFKRQVIFIKNVDTELKRTNSSNRSDREMSSEMMLDEIAQYKRTRASYFKSFAGVIDSSLSRIDALERMARDTGAAAPRDSAADSAKTFAAWLSMFNTPAAKEIGATDARSAQSLSGRLASQARYETQKIAQLMVEVHKKFSIPVACIVFVLIGAPLGIMARRGGIAVGAAYSLFFFIVYWAFLIAGESMADNLVISPFAAMWTANIVIGACGIFLLLLMIKETKFISFGFFWKLYHAVFGKPAEGAGAGRGIGSTLRLYWKESVEVPYRLLSRVIGILPAYLIRKFLGYLGGLFIVIVITVIVVDYVSNLRRFEDASFFTVALYYWYYLPWLFGFVFPIVILLSSMASIGSMARQNELTAIKAAGVNIRQLTLALLVLGMLCAGFGFYISEGVLPQANTARRQLDDQMQEHRSVARGAPAPPRGKPPATHQEYRRNFYYFGDSRNIYFFSDFRTEPLYARCVRRETFDGHVISRRIAADAADYKNGKWKFVKGTVTTFVRDSASVRPFDTLADTILSVKPEDMVAQIRSPEEMGYWELASYINKSRRRGEDVSKWRAQLDFKIALPFMNFIVILLGLSISARAGRKGGAVLFGIGLMLCFSFWIISQFAISFAQNGQIPALVGAWFGNILFLAVALPLYQRASR
ncbi:MAG TPA: LptF/LptG family permease [Chitinivibrionales bacterium]|nr:LptF/LptG family permease [Chitinivibrionales bacterium]